ncbi:hypothetical protein BDN70DRAFT_883975 [Pholiota conissans]|uniref:Uncharacterized protein n=1 Tax=Pholiota conissans TaxID=109636 RepID=A0A9P5YWK4_9AGAR|nr:hypothetical protein BDN70DRAFT_883975 [Pholiota conissans]
MRPTARRLVRVVPRKLLNVNDAKIYNRPRPQSEDRKQPTTMDLLFQKREEAGETWPENLRLEPQLKKIVFKEVDPKLRTVLKAMTKER